MDARNQFSFPNYRKAIYTQANELLLQSPAAGKYQRIIRNNCPVTGKTPGADKCIATTPLSFESLNVRKKSWISSDFTVILSFYVKSPSPCALVTSKTSP